LGHATPASRRQARSRLVAENVGNKFLVSQSSRRSPTGGIKKRTSILRTVCREADNFKRSPIIKMARDWAANDRYSHDFLTIGCRQRELMTNRGKMMPMVLTNESARLVKIAGQ
jgi:hypothetical protein